MLLLQKIKKVMVFLEILNFRYHFVFADTTQGTNANRTKVYINGVEDTSSGFDGTVSQNTNFSYNKNSQVLYFGHNTGATIQPDLYFREFIGVDGQQLDSSYFGEFKQGVWVPKDYSGTYGNNGFRLKFENASDLGMILLGIIMIFQQMDLVQTIK